MIRTSCFTAAAAALALAFSGAPRTVQAQSLSLADAVRLAVANNPVTETARLKSGEAEARARQSRGSLLPSVSASVLRSTHTMNTATLGFAFNAPDGTPFFNPDGEILGPVGSLDFRARIAQPIVDAAALERVRAAGDAIDAGSADIDAAEEQVAASAALAYIRVQRAVARVAAARADSALAQDLVRIAQDQVQAGTGVALDVTRARAQAATVRAQMLVARNEHERALLALLRIIGAPADTSVTLADTSVAPLDAEGMDDAAAVERALSHRPELRSNEAQIAEASRKERAVRLERLPTLSAFLDDGPIQGAGGSFLPTYTWGVQLSVPVFDGFRREGRASEMEAQRKEAEVRRRDLQADIALAVRTARLDLGSSSELVDAARDRLALAEDEVSQARDRFRAGVSGNLEVITGSLALTAAREQLIDALAAWQGARVALARSIGVAREIR